MKKCRIITTLFFSILFVYSTEALAELTKIADNIYCYADTKNASPSNSFGANTGIIIGKSGILVVDTLISSKEAQRFIKDIRAISDKPIKYVVNTHFHLDHTFGNSEFAKSGAVIISSINDRDNMVKHSEAALKNITRYGLTEKDMEGTSISYPVLTFTGRLELDLGDIKVELVQVGSSHTDGSIVVYLPEKKMLFAGDILFTDYHPNVIDGDIEGWLKSLDYILTLDTVTIIPGHGPISGKKDVRDMRDYLTVFDKTVKELSTKSDDPDFISAELKKALPPRAELGWLIKANVQFKYLSK